MKKIIQSSFSIEDNESKSVVLMFLIAFIWGVSQMFSYTAANTIFLVRYGASYLAYTFIFNAVLLPVTGLVIMKLSERISFSKYVVGTIIFFCISLTAFRVLLSFSSIKWPAMVYLLWIDIEFSLATVLFMSIMNKLFNIRETKRVYGPCYLGAEIAYMITGFVIPVFVKYVGALNLTQFAIGFDFISIFVYLWIYRSFPDKMKVHEKKIDEEESEVVHNIPIKSLFNEKIILGIFAFSALYASSLCFINNAYMDEAQRYLADETKIASFIALLYSISSIFVVVIKGFVTSRFMKVFGMTVSLALCPIIIGIIALLFIISSSFAISPLIIFLLAVLVKLMQTVFGSTIYDSAYFNVMQSLPAEKKDTVIKLSGTVVSYFITGIAGLVLLIMMRKFHATARELFIGMEIIIFAWIAVSFFLGSEYRKNLKNILKNRIVGAKELSLTDKSVIGALVEGLKSSFPQEIIYCIDMLDKINHPTIKNLIKQHSSNENVLVRIKVAEIYERKGDREDIRFLLECLNKEKDPEVINRWLQAIASSGEGDQVDLIESYLKNPDITIVMGAITALISYCGIEGTLAAGGELNRLSESQIPEERRYATEIIKTIGLPNLFRILKPLLSDPDIGVRIKAIEAAGILRHPRLINPLIKNLKNNELRPVVMASIINFGENSFSELENIYLNEPESRILIVYLYGRIKGDAAIVSLKNRLSEKDHDVLHEILNSLELCGYVPTDDDIPLLNGILKDSVEYGTRLLFASKDIGHSEHTAIIARALRNEMIKNKELVFYLLSFLYSNHDIKNIRFNYFYSNSEEKRSMSVELLDNILSNTHKKMILPLLEDTVPESSMNALIRMFPDKLIGETARIKQLCHNKSIWQNTWLRATAFHVLIKMFGDEGKDALTGEFCKCDTKEMSFALPAPEFQNNMSVVDVVSKMKKAEIFSEVSDEILAHAASHIEMEIIPENTNMFHRGDFGSTLYIIAQGRVKVHIGEKNVAEFKEGDIFGELSALNPKPRTADVTTLTKVMLLNISNKDIYQMIDDEIEIAKGIIRILCRRNRDILIKGTFKPKDIKQQHHPQPVIDQRIDIIQNESDKLSNIEKLFVFKTFAIFSNIPDNILNKLAELSKEIRLKQGETLFHKGDTGTSMYLMVRGEVKVHDNDTIINILSERTIIGELAALSSETRTSTITAAKQTQLLRITQKALYEIMWDQREVAKEFIRFLTERIQSMVK